MSRSNSAAVTNSLRLYDGRSAALVLMTSTDQRVSDALEAVFDLHGPGVVDPEEGPDWSADDVGDCTIGDDGVVLSVVGHGFTGIHFTAPWGRTPDQWKMNARLNGCVWLGLVAPDEHRRLANGGWTEPLPTMQLLKLAVMV